MAIRGQQAIDQSVASFLVFRHAEDGHAISVFCRDVTFQRVVAVTERNEGDAVAFPEGKGFGEVFGGIIEIPLSNQYVSEILMGPKEVREFPNGLLVPDCRTTEAIRLEMHGGEGEVEGGAGLEARLACQIGDGFLQVFLSLRHDFPYHLLLGSGDLGLDFRSESVVAHEAPDKLRAGPEIPGEPMFRRGEQFRRDDDLGNDQ